MADLVLGPTDRVLKRAETLLDQFLSDVAETGTAYLDYVPTTSADELVPEDLAVSTLMNSQAGARVFLSIRDRAHEVSERLAALPTITLEDSSPEVRADVVALISAVGQWNGIQVSVATKLLHKKRPALIPILDNQAIFGALLWTKWDPPTVKADANSVHGSNVTKIAEALKAIYDDLVRVENQSSWTELGRLAQEKHGRNPTRVEIFDMIWWAFFRSKQPYVPANKGRKPSAAGQAAS